MMPLQYRWCEAVSLMGNWLVSSKIQLYYINVHQGLAPLKYATNVANNCIVVLGSPGCTNFYF